MSSLPLPSIFADELGLAKFKEDGVPAVAESLTRALKNSILPQAAFAGQDWRVETPKLLGRSIKSHFNIDEPVWDIFVCLFILGHRKVSPAVVQAFAERKAPHPSESDKDDVRNSLTAFLTDGLTARNKLEHGAYFPLGALSSSLDSMLEGLKLLGEPVDSSLHDLDVELTRLAAITDSTTSQEYISASLFGVIHLRRAFSVFVDTFKGAIENCRKGSPDIKHLDNIGCDCSRRVWRHHLADGSATKTDLPVLLRGCPECADMMAACHEVASVCAHLKICSSGCGKGLASKVLGRIEEARNSFAHGSLSLIQVYDVLRDLEEIISHAASPAKLPPMRSEDFWQITLEHERTAAFQDLLGRAQSGGCREAAKLSTSDDILKHFFFKGKVCSACQPVFAAVDLKELSKVGSKNAQHLGANLLTLLRALGRPTAGSQVNVVVTKTPDSLSTAAQLPLPRTRSAFTMVGREDIHHDIKGKLVAGTWVGIYGRSGVGKSLLAREVVVSLEREAGSGAATNPFRYFRSIQASSRASLVRGWLSFARSLLALGAIGKYPDDSNLTEDQVLEEVRDPVATFLSVDSRANEFLLLIDDVASVEVANLLKELLTSPDGEPRCGLLCTGVTVQPLNHLSAELIEVPTLSMEHCMSIVANVDEGYRNVVDLRPFIQDKLVCHTLTVCVFASLLRQRNEPSMEERFRFVASALADDELAVGTDDHPRGLDGFVRLAVERLEINLSGEALALELLLKCVVLGANGTKISQLVLGEDAIREGVALGLLEAEDVSVLSQAWIHKLTRTSIQRLLTKRGALTYEAAWLRLCEGLQQLLNAKDSTASVRQSREAPVLTSLLEFLLEWPDVENTLSDEAKSAIAKSLVGGSRSAESASAFVNAQEYALRARTLLNKRGVIVEDANVADCYRALGNVANSMGRYEKAGEHYRRALAIWTKVYGTDEHANVASSYHALGNVADLMGRYEEAGEHHLRALAVWTKVYGTDGHADVASSYHALGNVARAMGRYEEAGEHYRRALAIRTKVYGTDGHADVALSYHAVGNVASSMGRYEEAGEHHRRALAVWTKVYGTDEHANVASSYHALGNVAKAMGRYEEAGEHHRRALAVWTKVYGTDEHANVASSYRALGNVARAMGRYEEAGEHHRRALAVWTKVYGTDEHANVASSYHALGNVANSMRRYEEAGKHYLRALVVWTKVYGTDEHANVASSYRALGNVARAMGRYEEAGEHYRRALLIRTKVYGTDEHADVASSYQALGTVAMSMGKYEKAWDYHLKALSIRTKVYGSDEHVDVASSYYALGTVVNVMGKHEEAVEHFRRALSIRVKAYGTDEHANVASCYHALGEVARKMGRNEEAVEHYRRAHLIKTKVYGTDEHADAVASYQALGHVAEATEGSQSSQSTPPSTPSPTVYRGFGRPRTSDYISPGVINYGASGSAGSTPSTPPRGGRGRK